MKKIINTILTIALAVIALQTADMLAANKRNYRGRRGNPRSSAARRRQSLAQARRIRQQKQAALAKKPAARKQEAQINQKMTQNTQALEKSIEQQKTAKTPEEKELAKKNTYQLANELLATLKQERTYSNDLYYGYEEEQIKNARLSLTKLYPMEEKVDNALTQKKLDLAQVTNEGLIWNEAQKGKEIEYNALSAEVTKLKNTLSRIREAIKDKRIIAGEKWSNAYKALLGAGTLAAGTIFADLATLAVAGKMVVTPKIAALAKSGADWVGQKGLTAWNMMPNLRSVPMPAIDVNPNSVTLDGKTIEKSAVSSQFGNLLAEATWGVLGIAKQVALSTAVSSTFTFAVKKLYALLEDPATTPAQLEAQNKEVQRLAAQEKDKK